MARDAREMQEEATVSRNVTVAARTILRSPETSGYIGKQKYACERRSFRVVEQKGKSVYMAEEINKKRTNDDCGNYCSHARTR